jgi:hypothetical protein
MDIRREKFEEIAKEQHNSEISYELFQIVHQALQDYNNGKGNFYNRVMGNTDQATQERFAVMAGLVVAEQLPLYTKEQAINSLIYELDQVKSSKGPNPKLKKIDLPKIIEDEIKEGNLLRVYLGRDAVYVHNHLNEYSRALLNHDRSGSVSADEIAKLQPYITALLVDEKFKDLTTNEQGVVAKLFKEQAEIFNQEQIKAYYTDPKNLPNLEKYITWDRDKVAKKLNEFIHYHIESNQPKFRDIYVHKRELDCVVKYCENKLISKSKSVLPDLNIEASDIANQMANEFRKNTQKGSVVHSSRIK